MAEPTNDPELDNLPVRAEEQGSSDSLPEFDSGGEMGPANPSRGYQESAASISDSAGISTMEESLRSRIQTTLNAPKLMHDSMTPSSVSHALLQEDLKFRSKHNNVLEQEMNLVMKMRAQHQLTRKINRQDAYTAEAAEAVQMLQNSYGGNETESEAIKGLLDRNPHWASNDMIMKSFSQITAMTEDKTETEMRHQKERETEARLQAIQSTSPIHKHNVRQAELGIKGITADQEESLRKAVEATTDRLGIIGDKDLLIKHGIDFNSAAFWEDSELQQELVDNYKGDWKRGELTIDDVRDSLQDLASVAVNRDAQGPAHEPATQEAISRLERGNYFKRVGGNMTAAKYERAASSIAAKEQIKKASKEYSAAWGNAVSGLDAERIDKDGKEVTAKIYRAISQNILKTYAYRIHTETGLKFASQMHDGYKETKANKITTRRARMIAELMRVEDAVIEEIGDEEVWPDGRLAARGHDLGLWVDDMSFLDLPGGGEDAGETTQEHYELAEAWIKKRAVAGKFAGLAKRSSEPKGEVNSNKGDSNKISVAAASVPVLTAGDDKPKPKPPKPASGKSRPGPNAAKLKEFDDEARAGRGATAAKKTQEELAYFYEENNIDKDKVADIKKKLKRANRKEAIKLNEELSLLLDPVVPSAAEQEVYRNIDAARNESAHVTNYLEKQQEKGKGE